jgi:hypothetical protein
VKFFNVQIVDIVATFMFLSLIDLLCFNATFSYIKATSFRGGRTIVPGEDHGQATGTIYYFQLRVECILFCNLQSQERTQAVLVMSLYELLGNPTT